MRVLIALGGNAFINSKNKADTINDQFEQSRLALAEIVRLVEDGHRVIITHGNGYQVGNILLRSERAKGEAYELPLYIADAQTQGELGTLLEQSLMNELSRRLINRRVAAVLTHVVVSGDDPAFGNPTKPIGGFYSHQEMLRVKKSNEVWLEDSGRGFRKYVSSPKPIDIVEKDIIKDLFEINTIVIACGGGGIPVIIKEGALIPVDCVIDKDFASALLATQVQIERFIILTGVENVFLNFNKKSRSVLETTNVSRMQRYLDEGQFPSGSMGPKIQSAIEFLKNNPRGEVIITSFKKLRDAFYSKAGTHIFY